MQRAYRLDKHHTENIVVLFSENRRELKARHVALSSCKIILVDRSIRNAKVVRNWIAHFLASIAVRADIQTVIFIEFRDHLWGHLMFSAK